MRIVSLAARTLRWPMASEGAARGRSERAAVVLELRSDGGAIGLGEAAPLPGLSTDTLGEAEQAIAAFIARPAFDVADGAAIAALVAGVGPASARFAIETALLDALAREGRPSERTGPRPLIVPLSAVVDDPDAARRHFAAGIRCFKLKLAADDDPARAFAIAAAVPGARLRIDANRSWPRSELAARLAALASLPIDYVEEPCRDSHTLLDQRLALPLALDESLAAISPRALDAALHSSQLAAVVLKPTLLGGLSQTRSLAARARTAGVAAIVSHGLEGPIGTAACATLALELAGPHAVGLATHPALTAWRLAVPQLAAAHVHPVEEPGLGFVGLDLAGAVQACSGTTSLG